MVMLISIVVCMLKQGEVTADLCTPWNCPQAAPSDLMDCHWDRDECVCRGIDLYERMRYYDKIIIFAC